MQHKTISIQSSAYIHTHKNGMARHGTARHARLVIPFRMLEICQFALPSKAAAWKWFLSGHLVTLKEAADPVRYGLVDELVEDPKACLARALEKVGLGEARLGQARDGEARPARQGKSHASQGGLAIEQGYVMLRLALFRFRCEEYALHSLISLLSLSLPLLCPFLPARAQAGLSSASITAYGAAKHQLQERVREVVARHPDATRKILGQHLAGGKAKL